LFDEDATKSEPVVSMRGTFAGLAVRMPRTGIVHVKIYDVRHVVLQLLFCLRVRLCSDIDLTTTVVDQITFLCGYDGDDPRRLQIAWLTAIGTVFCGVNLSAGSFHPMASILESALAADHLILANAGSHAKQAWHKIIARKSADIGRAKHTVWVVNSNAARPDAVQLLCKDHDARYVIFVNRVRDAKGGDGTSRDHPARTYSEDNLKFDKLDSGLSEVTGDIKRSTTGFWFDALEEELSGSLDLGCYVKVGDGKVLDRFWPSDSAYPVRRARDARSGSYQILGVGRLASPFAVWLQK
jgi:hypothetical protein